MSPLHDAEEMSDGADMNIDQSNIKLPIKSLRFPQQDYHILELGVKIVIMVSSSVRAGRVELEYSIIL